MNAMAGIDVELPAGFVARPIDPDADAQAVTDLVNVAAIAEYGTPEGTLQMVQESYRMPSFNPATDGRQPVLCEGRDIRTTS